jgi:uncharacterized protein (DUF983 family)
MPFGNRCPRCGDGRLFGGFVTLRPSCGRCGLDYAFADAGDGPAVFVILLAGAAMVALLLWVEVTYQPPVWLLLAIFLPLTLAVCLGMLRPLKAALIHQQFRRKAEQARARR